VVITLGGEGALIAEGEAVQRVAALRVDVVDTTGAGDTVCGAIAAALARDVALVDAVRLGVTAGSLACTVAGAQPSIPTLAMIERSLAPG
jgi:ribokinase